MPSPGRRLTGGSPLNTCPQSGDVQGFGQLSSDSWQAPHPAPGGHIVRSCPVSTATPCSPLIPGLVGCPTWDQRAESCGPRRQRLSDRRILTIYLRAFGHSAGRPLVDADCAAWRCRALAAAPNGVRISMQSASEQHRVAFATACCFHRNTGLFRSLEHAVTNAILRCCECKSMLLRMTTWPPCLNSGLGG